MEKNFSKPQRQSQIGVLVMFFDTLRQFGKAFWPFLLIWIFRLDELNKIWLVLGLLFFLLVTGIAAYLKYRNFTFFIDTDNHEFIINEGVFNKTKTAIRLDKIQQVNINQTLMQRIINVFAVDVDSAGSNQKEGKIKAVSHDVALALKARLLDSQPAAAYLDQVEPQAIEESKPFLQISLLSLLKVGITSNYIRSIGLILAFFVTIYDNLRQFSEYEAIDTTEIDGYFERNMVSQSILILIFVLLAAILIINIFRTVIKYYNFRLTRQSGSLLLSYGLFANKSTILRPARVQIASLSQNYFQKKLNVSELKIKQAGNSEKSDHSAAIEIPGCDQREQSEILKLIFDAVPIKGAALKPNFRKLGFAVVLAIVVPLSVYIAMAVGNPELFVYAWPAAIYVVFAGLVLYFGWRNYRLFVSDQFIIKQSGAWDISLDIIENAKIQAITTSQLFWHKSLNIGTVTIHTAGGNIRFDLGHFDTIKQHVNTWLYKIETSDSNWM